VIVFAPANAGPLMRVPASGGMPQPVTALDVERGESAHRFPTFLPDGDHFTYAVLPPHAGVYDISVGSLSSTQRERLLVAESAVVFAEPGFLLFVRGGGLVAHRFDAKRRALIGDAVPLEDVPGGVGENRSGVPAVSVSSMGTMVYLVNPAVNTRLVLSDQSGREAGQVSVPAGRYVSVSVSRDGRRAVLARTTSPAAMELWSVDLERGGATRLANAPGLNLFPVWSPHDDRVAFASDRDGPQDLFVTSAGDATAEEPVFRSKALFKQPQSWSPDGRFIVYSEYSPSTNQDLWVVPTTRAPQPHAYLQTPANELGGRISPDGRWMLYISDETGRNEAYVQSFPKPGRKFQATTHGAAAAWWKNDGKQLLIANADLTDILVADVQSGDRFSASLPRVVGRLPRGGIVSTSGVALDVTPDFRRLVTLVPERSDNASIAVVQNWAPREK
jgi:eukaryotic-like serine/threonine-protein kinase